MIDPLVVDILVALLIITPLPLIGVVQFRQRQGKSARTWFAAYFVLVLMTAIALAINFVTVS